jgi:hypothetical protein
MKMLKKAAIAAAALSMVAAPAAASANQFDGLRADSAVSDEFAMGEGGSSWILILLAGAAIIGGIVIAADGSDDSPTSP